MERNNVVALIGKVKSIRDIKCINGMDFTGKELLIETERKSGTKDETVVLAEENAFNGEKGEIKKDGAAVIVGAIQTSRCKETGKVLVYVLAETVQPITGNNWQNENEIELKGTIAKGTTYRETPKGKRITDIFIKTECLTGKAPCFIPCICWKGNALIAAKKVEGDTIHIKGRIQSREYIKVLESGERETRHCYEVSVYRIEE